MTSVRGKRHLQDLARDKRASICVDVKEGPSRRHRQVRARGLAQVSVDQDGTWTRRITRKYLRGPDGELVVERRAAMPRLLIALRPDRLERIATP